MKVSEAIEKRWSPRAFSNQEIDRNQMKSLLEAAGTAPSCFNEQPWRYLIGFKGDDSYNKIMDCLVEFNQNWAKTAPVLMIGVVSKEFARNEKPNPHARHDLGAATAYLTIQAMEHDIFVHQMAGFSADKAKEKFNIPDSYEAVTAIALGYIGDSSQLPKDLQDQEKPSRDRKALKEISFEGDWAKSMK
ncbi:MAG: nitroreductase family protein [Vicingaceae bacterium]